MRNIVWLPLFIFPLVAHAVQDCTLNGASINPSNGFTTQGKSGIMRCVERDTGEVQREQELRNGQYIGIVRYFKEGRVEREFSVNERGNKEGVGREFSVKTGKVVREETYRNGTTIGLGRTFFPEGQRRRIAFRDEQGKELAFVEFNDRGQLRDLRCGDRPYLGKEADEAAWCGFGKRGEPVVTVLHNDKGEPRGKVSYLNGSLVASESLQGDGKPGFQREIAASGAEVERSFWPNGNKRGEIHWNKEERGRSKTLEREYHESGKLVRERRWQAGELAEEHAWYLNGQARAESRYSRQDGKWLVVKKEFHDNGKPATSGNFAQADRYREIPVGEHRRFDNEGRLRQLRQFDDKGRLQRESEMDETGKVLRDDEVFEDGSRKALSTRRPGT